MALTISLDKPFSARRGAEYMIFFFYTLQILVFIETRSVLLLPVGLSEGFIYKFTALHLSLNIQRNRLFLLLPPLSSYIFVFFFLYKKRRKAICWRITLDRSSLTPRWMQRHHHHHHRPRRAERLVSLDRQR